MNNQIRVMLVWLMLLCNINCRSSNEVETIKKPITRIIKFSGIDWIVRTTNDKKEGPGPNLFSDSDKNVWIDEKGSLHLKIRQDGGNWYCSGIIAQKSMGYGKYVFYINSDVTTLDQNVVAGLFTYLNDNEEIDIEFSKWSKPNNMNSQFASQPSEVIGNKKRFDIPFAIGPTMHFFDWRANEILFKSSFTAANGIMNTIDEWTYSGKDVPKEKTEKLRLNLWLFKGQIPSDFKEQELVIDSVRFIKQYY